MKESRLSKSIKYKISDKSALKTIVQLLGDLDSEDGMKVLEEGGVPMPGGGVAVTQMMGVVQAQYNKAIKNGDTGAAIFLRDTGWGKPSMDEKGDNNKVEKMAIASSVIDILQGKMEERESFIGAGELSDHSGADVECVELAIDEDGRPMLCQEVQEGDDEQ